MQAIFRNPMADPGLVGVSAGGALGAIIAPGGSGVLGAVLGAAIGGAAGAAADSNNDVRCR